MIARRLIGWSLAATLLLSAGCEQSIWVRRYPDFYSEDIKVVAVDRFENLTPHPRAG